MLTSIKQRIICLDFEGTLVPEFWPVGADSLGIEELRLTTKEFPDFTVLMNLRIKALNTNNIKLPDLIRIAQTIEPLEGAVDFICGLQEKIPRVIVVSDCAEELAEPVAGKFSGINYFGNRFATNQTGAITHFDFRQPDQKRKVVNALQLLEYDVYVAGDSYNDLPMLLPANKGFLFRANDKIRAEHPQFSHTESYDELLSWLTEGL